MVTRDLPNLHPWCEAVTRLERARAVTRMNELRDYNRRLATNIVALAADFSLWPWLDSLLLDGYPTPRARRKLPACTPVFKPGMPF
jgi:hypothetical protein